MSANHSPVKTNLCFIVGKETKKGGGGSGNNFEEGDHPDERFDNQVNRTSPMPSTVIQCGDHGGRVNHAKVVGDQGLGHRWPRSNWG